MDLSEHYNVYCDESCHLENDHQKVMTLGAVWCAIWTVYLVTKTHTKMKLKKEHEAYKKLKPPF